LATPGSDVANPGAASSAATTEKRVGAKKRIGIVGTGIPRAGHHYFEK